MGIMNRSIIIFLLLYLSLGTICCKSPESDENTEVLMKTTLGDIKLKLYNQTPKHRDNFIKLVTAGVYEGVSFHRVINSFMIQAGDPLTRTGGIPRGSDSLATYTIEAEFNTTYFHKKGALAAARQGNDVNPEMRSSGTQFYIVQGTKLTDAELDRAEQSINNNLNQAMFAKFLKQVRDSSLSTNQSLTDGEIQEKASTLMFEYLSSNEIYKLSPEQRNIYKTIGGVPRLDRTYTVFGEVTEGLDIVDRIAAVSTDNRDRPLSDIKILKMKILN